MVYRLKMLGRGRSRDRVLRGCSGGQGRGEGMGECQSPECSGPPTHPPCLLQTQCILAHGLVPASTALLAHGQYWGPNCSTQKSLSGLPSAPPSVTWGQLPP